MQLRGFIAVLLKDGRMELQFEGFFMSDIIMNTRWLDDVSTDLRKMEINEWRDRARDREAWKRIVMEAKAHLGL
jgi:tRNA splicing endonuclease